MKWERLLSRGRFGDSPGFIPTQVVRSEFEVDYDRIIFSSPFRNLQDKTQVFPLPEQAFVHTRLTHSLEVSSVGRSLGKAAGEMLLEKYPLLNKTGITPFEIGAIVAAASLTHDIGNPPFGHAGEEAISDFFKFHSAGKCWESHVRTEQLADLCNFEGNAQGFRMLVSKQFGLKLTYATLAAFSKYPRPSMIAQRDIARRSQKKYGFFINQLADFEQMGTVLGMEKSSPECWYRHPLAFLVEAADDICYSIIDLEDGCTLGLVSFEETVKLLAPILKDKFDPKKLKEPRTLAQNLGALRALAIGELISECVDVFANYEEGMCKGNFDKALTDIIPSAKALQMISEVSVQKIYRSQVVLEKEAAGFQVIEGLLEVFSKALYHQFYDPDNFSGQDKSILRLLPEDFPLKGWGAEVNPYPLLRSLVDFISGMTDKYALNLYRRVKGISFPGS
ncbi:dNTP triphosphohydrolase [Algoriphagus sp. D3-2-R+10]|uniref:dGTP triphosphohydrolase n=1 Tax=Algoriphagus aurantiacus TaxID=3103948 RepID=UPI002B36B629|nr:dNTP triphosphohydrolase [Algoriphagus sp. D3-2-R+10]MEB2773964.1 dNTP triphosphohydrolase [Algoriphagus sp. D3-2-R+10]